MRRYRTIWISDVHLGTRGCKAEFLLDFLRHNDADTIYLVGDIIDGWRLKKSWYWPQTHNDVVQKLLRMVRKGTRAVYVPGQSRRVAARLHRAAVRRRRDPRRGDPRHRRRPPAVGHARRRVRCGRHPCPLARLARRRRLHRDACGSTAISTRRGGGSAIPIGRCRPISSGASRTRCNTSSRLATRSPTRPAAAAPTASSAAISTTPRSAISAACSIATAAIGSRAAPLSSSISTARLELVRWIVQRVVRSARDRDGVGVRARGRRARNRRGAFD